MYNPGEVRVFVLKVATSGPHLTFFYEYNAITRGELPFGTVPGVPALNCKTFIWSLPIFGRKMFQKSQSTRSPAQSKSGPSNNMQVSRFDHLVYHFSITILPHLASVTRKNTFEKKKSSGNAHWTNYWICIEGSWTPWPYVNSYK